MLYETFVEPNKNYNNYNNNDDNVQSVIITSKGGFSLSFARWRLQTGRRSLCMAAGRFNARLETC